MTNIQEEIWKDIPGYEGVYKINTSGLVFSYKNNRNLCPHFIKGYPSYTLFHKDQRKSFYAHRLIMICFVPNPENLPVVNHKNGIRDDNRIENLEWCTVSHNNAHAFLIGLRESMKGEGHPNCKLTDVQVEEIKSLSGKESHRSMGRRFGVSKTQISWIINGKSRAIKN